MLTPDRQAMILKIVKENRVASIHDLVKSTKCSESTIRRDLDQLEKAHQLLRFHGGAQAIPQKSDERTINERALSFLNEKRAIARRGAEYVEAGDCLFLDAGTTTYQMIDFLPPGTIVVTNGLTLIARCIEKKNCKLMSLAAWSNR
ncbi:DeoR/GlpR family DNA-binding transcription regulator [Terrilactibacillus sp. S3-3]|nr:DeoR/GlpR family DNA-binding transcription regulator [Terrilactibacillus sp. S3-3]